MVTFWPFSSATYWEDFFKVGTYDNFITKSCQWVSNDLSRCLPSESIFFKVDSALNTSVVANCRFAMVARQTDDILTRRLLQLYFLRTFQQISFSGYILAVFNAYQLEGWFFGSPKFRGFSIKICSLKQNSSIFRYFTKGTSVIRSPAITKAGWLKCQWCGASPPPDDSPLLGCRGRIWETLTY